MEKITIRNFGPIKQAEIIIRPVTIFIGTTSSGKSTAAKLISIFQTLPAFATDSTILHRLLADYNIDFSITEKTSIVYQRNEHVFELKGGTIKNSFARYGVTGYLPIYIPAERMFFSTISQSIFSLISSNISLPKWLIDFGAKFEQARNSIKKLSIDFLQAGYEYDDRTDYVQIEGGVKIRLSQASSGLQSVIPMVLVIRFNTDINKSVKELFVIEEPELNLYPASQKDLIEFIIGRVNQSNDHLIITTHSPYLLTSLDNLIQAKNIVDGNPLLQETVETLVKKDYWLDFDKVSCYYFKDGGCHSTLDEELGSIGPSNIDDVSLELSKTFESLLSLKYPA